MNKIDLFKLKQNAKYQLNCLEIMNFTYLLFTEIAKMP